MRRFCSACGHRLPSHDPYCDASGDAPEAGQTVPEEWEMLASAGLDLKVDALEAALVAAGADSLAVVVFAHGEQWVRLGGAWNSAVLGAAVEAIAEGMDPALIVPPPRQRLDA